MYHRVLPDGESGRYPLRNLVVTESRFRSHVEWLSRHCRVRTVREAMAGGDGDSSDHRPTVCLTFDDGYWDNFKVAAPILEEAGVRATFYVATDFVVGVPFWFDVASEAWGRLGAGRVQQILASIAPRHRERPASGSVDAWLGFLKRGCTPVERSGIVAAIAAEMPPLCRLFSAMTPEQVRELGRRGHEIGSHTVTHPSLPKLEEAQLRMELKESRHRLEEWTGCEVRGLCYPGGDHDPRVVAAAASAGYRHACTTVRGTNAIEGDSLRLRRRFITMTNTTAGNGRHSDLVFGSEVLGVHESMARWSQWLRRR